MLTGARVIVTGASSGLGRALAKELANQQARLVLAARSLKELDQLASEIRGQGREAVAVATDVALSDHRERLIQESINAFGGIDILVNNAGIGASGYFAEASEARLRRVFEVNFFAATELTRLAIPHLQRGQNAMIVNISSVIGRRGIPGYTEYCSSKFAMCGWSEALRAELAHHNIHVLLVCPGLIETPFREHQVEDKLRYKWQTHRAMSAERCARIIVQAMRKRRNEIVITAQGKFLVWMNRLFPRLLDWGLARHSGKEDMVQPQ